MTVSLDDPIRVEVGEDGFVLSGHELDRLLGALGRLEPGDAETVREQIAALRLAGRVIDLTPTTAELAALRLALQLLAEGVEPLSPALLQLFEICTDEVPAGARA